MGMFTMNEKQRAKWERTRTKGMARFVAVYAVALTIALSVTMSVFDYFVDFRGFQPWKLKIEIPIFLICGILGGVAMWAVAERQYRKPSGLA
jgi:hypothetical protein